MNIKIYDSDGNEIIIPPGFTLLIENDSTLFINHKKCAVIISFEPERLNERDQLEKELAEMKKELADLD